MNALGPAATRTAYTLAAGIGLVLWVLTALFTHQREPWDAPLYWQFSYPLAILLCGALGWAFPERPWRWVLTLMWMQAPVMAIKGSDFSLLPLGLILLAVLALPGIGVANWLAGRRQAALGGTK